LIELLPIPPLWKSQTNQAIVKTPAAIERSIAIALFRRAENRDVIVYGYFDDRRGRTIVDLSARPPFDRNRSATINLAQHMRTGDEHSRRYEESAAGALT